MPLWAIRSRVDRSSSNSSEHRLSMIDLLPDPGGRFERGGWLCNCTPAVNCWKPLGARESNVYVPGAHRTFSGRRFKE
jgi:hypothetical protein